MKLQNEVSKFETAFKSIFSEIDIESYIDRIKKGAEYKDLKTRIVWDFLYYSIQRGFLTYDYLDYLRETYGANDTHIDTVLKKAIDKFDLKF